MFTPGSGDQLLQPTPRGAMAQRVVDAFQLFVVMAFVYTSTQPAVVLAFADEINGPYQPLVFSQDAELLEHAVSAEAIRSGRANRFLAIPTASPFLAPGMTIRVFATAYSSTVGQTDSDPFTTASGIRAQDGTLAANFLPFGSQVRIGGRVYEVQDRLHERYNNKYIVDLWQPDEASALAFGVQVVELEIVSLP